MGKPPWFTGLRCHPLPRRGRVRRLATSLPPAASGADEKQHGTAQAEDDDRRNGGDYGTLWDMMGYLNGVITNITILLCLWDYYHVYGIIMDRLWR